MPSLIHRASGSLAVKALPALYGVGLILLVVRVLPLGDFGRYGMAIAYMNLVSALSRGLWGVPLVIRTARGEQSQALAPAFLSGIMTAVAGGLIGLVLLTSLGAGIELAGLTFLMLLVLVPRDIAVGLAQAEGRVWKAFWIESGYFLGSLLGFAICTQQGVLQTAEVALLINVIAAVLSAGLGVLLERASVRPGWRGDWKGNYRIGGWISLLTTGELFLQQGDILILAIYFSPEEIAPYVAARTLLRMYGLFSQSVNFLVLPSASRLMASGQLDRLRDRLRTVLWGMMGVLVLANLLMWFVGLKLIPFMLGSKYIPAIPLFSVLIIATFLEPWYSVLTNALAGIGKPRTTLYVLLVSAALNIALNMTLLPLVGISFAPNVLVLTYAILAVGSYLLGRHNHIL